MRPKPWSCRIAVAVLAAVVGCDDSPTDPPPHRSECADAILVAPLHRFDAELLAQRRAALLEAMGSGVAWFPAMENPEGSGRQESEFYYFTGLDTQDVWLILVAREDGPDEELLYVGPGAQGDGPVPAHEMTGIDDVRCLAVAPAEMDSIAALASAADTLMVAPAVWHQAGTYDGQLAAWPGPIDLTSRFRHRYVKDAAEQERLRRSARISAGGLLAGMAQVAPGAFEGDIKAVIETAYADSGAARTAFGSIVASGSNSLELHYGDAADTLRAGEVIIIDVGAEYARYAGDVARTLPVSGTYTPRQREIYEILLAGRQAVLDAFAAGLSTADAEEAFYEAFNANWEACGTWCTDHMPHLLFHPVGLDVHDGQYLPGRAAGVVLNVEPGLYFPTEGFGMRIEDTVLLTEAGYVLLTDGLPTTVDEIEAFMAQQTETVR